VEEQEEEEEVDGDDGEEKVRCVERDETAVDASSFVSGA
jgi:hypothetical protein